MKYFDEAVNVTFTGIVIVFTMLVLLVLVLTFFGLIMTAISKAGARKAEKHNKAELAKMLAESTPTDASAPEQVTSVADNELEIVAVISAAVAMMYQNTGKKPVIKAIKKSGSRRSAWASAGLIDNTRSF